MLSNSTKLELINLQAEGEHTFTQMSEETGVPRTTLTDFLKRKTSLVWWEEYDALLEKNKGDVEKAFLALGVKILVFDVETSPEKSYHFGRWKVNISEDKVIQRGHMLTWAAKWLDKDEIYSDKLTNYDMFDEDPHNDLQIVHSLWRMIDEADIIVAHNGIGFDEPYFNARCLIHDLIPPSPYKQIDTLKEVRKAFRFPSNALKSLMNALDLTRKIENEGFYLWRKCDEGDKEAFNTMEEYNIGDIVSLQELYLKIRPWMKNHPNLGTFFDDTEKHCVACGSTNLSLMEGKFSRTNVSVFAVHRCNDCGKVSRDKLNLRTPEQRKATLNNAL